MSASPAVRAEPLRLSVVIPTYCRAEGVARLVEHCERRGPVRPASPRSPQAAAPTDPAADE